MQRSKYSMHMSDVYWPYPVHSEKYHPKPTSYICGKLRSVCVMDLKTIVTRRKILGEIVPKNWHISRIGMTKFFCW